MSEDSKKRPLRNTIADFTGLNFLRASYKPPISEQVQQQARGEAWFRNFQWEQLATTYLPGTGLGFTVYPFVAVWEKIWGAVPPEDYEKIKEYITKEPFIRATLDMHTFISISGGYDIDYPIDTVKEDVRKFLEKHDFINLLKVIVRDGLAFGNSYTEIVRLWICPHIDHNLSSLQPSYEKKKVDGTGWWWSDRMDVVNHHNEMYPDHKLENPFGEIVRLKPLDPTWMRVRRDAYGTILGYSQYYMWPIVTFLADEVLHIRYMPTSASYESIYGSSIVRPILFHQELLKEYEEIMGQIMNIYIKPMFIVKVKSGIPGNEVSQDQYNQTIQAFARRRAGSDIILRGGAVDLEVDPINPPIDRMQTTQFWLDWLHKMRSYSLVVPKFAVDPQGLNRATSKVVEEFYFSFIASVRSSLISQVERELMPFIMTTLYGQMGKDLYERFGAPKILFKPLKHESLQTMQPIISGLRKDRLITVNEGRRMMGLPPLEPEELLSEMMKPEGLVSEGDKEGRPQIPTLVGPQLGSIIQEELEVPEKSPRVPRTGETPPQEGIDSQQMADEAREEKYAKMGVPPPAREETAPKVDKNEVYRRSGAPPPIRPRENEARGSPKPMPRPNPMPNPQPSGQPSGAESPPGQPPTPIRKRRVRPSRYKSNPDTV
jgi:hypothetical protein